MKWNVFVKLNEQNKARFNSAMARKRRMKSKNEIQEWNSGMKSKDKIQENDMAIRNGLLKKLCGSPELLTFKTVKWRYRDKREDDVGTHSQKWQSTKPDQTITSWQGVTVTVLQFWKIKKTSLPTTMLGRVSTNHEVAIHEWGRMQWWPIQNNLGRLSNFYGYLLGSYFHLLLKLVSKPFRILILFV